ncbi:transient receptor potential cation channel protein painless-like [Anopheles aquasalis]|uniref:transient receptor potential cation channel protein painless-like n=1 Tax=Anopheles aquasalis TaxID=42839 RepID=UPI00215AFEDD|nr:transient receptor potential cation channel protein painless-like [Anopheles aquasalis]
MNSQTIIDLNPNIPQHDLAEILKQNDLETLKEALRNGGNVNERDPNAEYSIFEQACLTPGRKDFIAACIDNGALVAEINPKTNEYPIHLAALSEDCENLSALLEGPRIVIDQKFEDRTALFLLFEKLSGDNYEKVFECIKLLLSHGANINATNQNDVSPIQMLAMKNENWRKDILEYCFNNHYGINVDFRNQKARKLIEKNFPDVTIPHYDMENITVEVLKSKLLASVEEDFLEVFRKFGAQTGALADNDFKDLFSLAVYHVKLEAAKMLVEPKMNNGMLPDASLLLSGLLAKCCNRGNVDMLQWLLSIIPKNEIGLINEDALLSLLVKQIDVSKDKNKCPYFKIMKLLLEDGRIDIDKPDSTTKRTALHYAVKYKIDHAQQLLLAKGTSVSVEDMFSELPISDMDPFLLEKHLDSCVSSNDRKPGDDDYEVKIDLANFVPPAPSANYLDYEMLPILHMAQQSDMKHLLRHPVISSLLLLKWFKLKMFFYANLLVCSLFFVTFIFYVVFWHGRDDILAKWTFYGLSLFLHLCLILRELFQILLNMQMYVRSAENYMEIALIVGAALVLWFNLIEVYRQVISALVIIMIAFELTLLIGTLPRLSITTYVVMLKTVSKNFLKCLGLFSILLFAFVFSFYTLFRESDYRQPTDTSHAHVFNKFHNISLAFIKVAAMMIGELEASNFEFNDFNWIVFALFLFFVPLVLNSLINGLAISDITKIKAESEITALTEKVFMIHKHGNGSKAPEWFRKHLPRIRNTVSLPHIVIKPNKSNAIWMPAPVERGLLVPKAESDGPTESESRRMLTGTDEPHSGKWVEFSHGMDGKIVKHALNILYPPKRNRAEC